MKILFGSLIIAVSGTAALAQGTVAPRPSAPVDVKSPVEAAKVYAELAAAKPASSIKNSPFSGEEVNESVQTLFDGNRIVRSSTGKIYRNSEGRVRRESGNSLGGVFGTTFSVGQGVSIVNPIENQRYILDEKLKTAQVVELASQAKAYVAAAQDHEKRAIEMNHNNLAAQLKGAPKSSSPTLITGQGGAVNLIAPVQPLPPTAMTVDSHALLKVAGTTHKYDVRTEELGTRDFEGVTAEGTRKTTTIPAGAIGNERPIEVVYERWYSKELGMVVYSKNTDPRFGEQIYQLKNIVRAEPDPSLFSIPTEYRRIGVPGEPVRLTTTTGRSVDRKPTTVKAVPVSSPAKAARP